MLFNEFANKLYPIIGEGKAISVFVEELFENITCFDDEDNILSKTSPSTFKSYYSGQNTISTFSKKIRKYLDSTRFENYLDSQPEDAQVQICEAFKSDIKDINNINIITKVSDYFKEIICIASERKRVKKIVHNNNEDTKHKIGANDFDLLVECNSQCPICGNSLIRNNSGNIINSYLHLYIIDPMCDNDIKRQIVEELGTLKNLKIDKPENELLVCEKCYYELQDTDIIERTYRIYDIKKKLQDKNKITDIIHSESVENGIRLLLSRLSNLDSAPCISESYEAFKVENKIPHDYVLKQRVLDYVLRYYRFVRETFNELQNEEVLRFNKVRNEVSQVFERLDEQGLNQRKIFESLVDWLKEATGSDDRISCEIIISFFVQNCEVFYETPE